MVIIYSRLPSGQNSKIIVTLFSVKKQSYILVVNILSGSVLKASSFRTLTYPSTLSDKITDNLFDFSSILFDKVKWQYPYSNNFLGFSDDPFVDFSKGSLTNKILLLVLVLTVFENFGHLFSRRLGFSLFG